MKTINGVSTSNSGRGILDMGRVIVYNRGMIGIISIRGVMTIGREAYHPWYKLLHTFRHAHSVMVW